MIHISLCIWAWDRNFPFLISHKGRARSKIVHSGVAFLVFLLFLSNFLHLLYASSKASMYLLLTFIGYPDMYFCMSLEQSMRCSWTSMPGSMHPPGLTGSQPASQSWVGKNSTFLIFPQITINFSYFSSNFAHFILYFHPPGGRLAHP